MRKGLGILVGAMVLVVGTASGQAIGPGSGESSATLLGTMKVPTYRPTDCTPCLVLASFHGPTRNSGTNRDATRPLKSSETSEAFQDWDHRSGCRPAQSAGLVRTDSPRDGIA